MAAKDIPVKFIWDALYTSFMAQIESDIEFCRFICSRMDIKDIPEVVVPKKVKDHAIVLTLHLSDRALELYYQYKERAEKP